METISFLMGDNKLDSAKGRTYLKEHIIYENAVFRFYYHSDSLQKRIKGDFFAIAKDSETGCLSGYKVISGSCKKDGKDILLKGKYIYVLNVDTTIRISKIYNVLK